MVGKLETVCTMTNINIVMTVIEENHRWSIGALTTELKISRKSIHLILMDELGMKLVCLA